jgi:hypothetical protein
MALKSNFNAGRSMRDVQRQADNLYVKIFNSFIVAGENFIRDARGQMQSHEMGTYMDQTTNLRNSIGYFIFHDGRVVKEVSNYPPNRQLVQDVVKDQGIQLIGIAGMNYASHVESKGYNVISYQADVCMVNLALYLETLGQIEKGSAARLEETFIP